MVTDKRFKGDSAEALACRWLESKGYCLIEANYIRKVGEIDLIMKAPNDGPVVFVEVRFRTSNRFGGALASVNHRKRQKLIKTASAWLQANADSRTAARFDIIAMEPAASETQGTDIWQGHQIQWIVNAIEQ